MNAAYGPVGKEILDENVRAARVLSYEPLPLEREGGVAAIAECLDDFMDVESRNRSYMYDNDISYHQYKRQFVERDEGTGNVQLISRVLLQHAIYNGWRDDSVRERYKLEINRFDNDFMKFYGNSYILLRYSGRLASMSLQSSADFYQTEIGLDGATANRHIGWRDACAYDVNSLFDEVSQLNLLQVRAQQPADVSHFTLDKVSGAEHTDGVI